MLSLPGRRQVPDALGPGGGALREPRTTKSFRDAGDRIVRQESALSPSIGGLLGAPSHTARRATNENDAWEVRLAALAALGHYDGLTFVSTGAAEAPAAYNLIVDPASEPAIRDAIDHVTQSATTMQLRTSVPLADGRVASAALVTSLALSDDFSGALVALRVGRPFAAVDTYTAVSISEIVSLELARSVAAGREATDRRQAFALYEIARQALFGDNLDETLQSIAMVLATTLDHEAVHIWLRRPDRSLRRHAAHPPDGPTSEILWESDHSALSGALHERRLVRMSGAEDLAWTPSNTGHVLVVPLRSDPRPVGVLLLARAYAPYRLDDIEMADVLGTFIGRVVASATSRPSESAGQADAVRPVTDLERGEELAEAH
jgi:GAF domain-containing protein